MPHARTASAAPLAATDDAVVAAAKAGDESAFAVLVDRHRRELHVHCYPRPPTTPCLVRGPSRG